MTLVTNWYTMDSKLGVNLNTVVSFQTTNSQPEYPLNGQPMNLLDRVQGNFGSEWVLVQASTTVTAGNLIVISNIGIANDATSALAASNVYALGIANFQNGDGGSPGTGVAYCNGITGSNAGGSFFWALLKANGGVGVNVSPSVGRGVAMYISGTAGSFTSSVTSNQVFGIELVASIGTSASGPGEAVINTYMRFGTGEV